MSKKLLKIEFKNLVHQLSQHIDRVPGFAEILLKILTIPLIDRIRVLKALSRYLENYPGVKFTGIRINPRERQAWPVSKSERCSLSVEFKCIECKKPSKSSIYPIHPSYLAGGVKGEGMKCRDCVYADCDSSEYESPLSQELTESEEEDFKRQHTDLEDSSDSGISLKDIPF